MAAEDIESRIATNKRVPADLAAEIRKTRQGEAWESYDTVVVGPGANARDPGWFDTWAAFANASEIQWFRTRSSSVGESYTNRPFDRWDYAFDIHMIGIEYLAPLAFGQFASNPVEALTGPEIWTRKLPERMPYKLKIADTDELLILPGSHAPAGVGPYGGIASADAAQYHAPPTNGQPLFVNRWRLGEPIMVPRGSTFVIRSRVDEPLRNCIAEMIGPGFYNLPTGQTVATGGDLFMRCPAYYEIRITLVGVRYVMLRGGYSAA